VFGIPPLDVLKQRRVIICTMMASIYLILGGMSQSFTSVFGIFQSLPLYQWIPLTVRHIIIDEAGQVNELDTLVPISLF
jgi:hypothetical protein